MPYVRSLSGRTGVAARSSLRMYLPGMILALLWIARKARRFRLVITAPLIMICS